MNPLASADLVISMRPCRAEDEPFLMQVYSSTRADEMALVPWTQEQKEAFLRTQYEAQYRHYVANFPGAQFLVILMRREPIGRLYLHRAPQEILILDIALLPQYRNMGIGTMLIRGLQEEARRTHSIIRLHVESFNQAMTLYQKLGFTTTAEISFYYEMTWQPVSETVDVPSGGKHDAA